MSTYYLDRLERAASNYRKHLNGEDVDGMDWQEAGFDGRDTREAHLWMELGEARAEFIANGGEWE
jgi:hypothetical protein